MKIKDTFLASTLFFLVLSSWYVLRAVRNEFAVENYSQDFLLILLAFTALVMLIVNPIYSWIASRSNFKKIVIYCYSFLILNLFIFLLISTNLSDDNQLGRIWLGRVFYVWCNIYSFFVVSIFWVLIINVFRDSNSKKSYGFIMAGGSLGGIFGSEIAVRISENFAYSGIESFVISSSVLLILGLILAIYIFHSVDSRNLSDVVGGKWMDASYNIISHKDIRTIAIYSWLLTACMTIQWISAIPIIENFLQTPTERIELFGRIEQIVSPLTLISQLFFTYMMISFLGIKFILTIYGLIFIIIFILYGFFPSVTAVIFAQVVLRVFEYAFNKPSREIVYSQMNKNNRYKTSVFIDTFVTRFGDLTGSIFVGFVKFSGIVISMTPLLALPLAFLLSRTGLKIFSFKKFTNL